MSHNAETHSTVRVAGFRFRTLLTRKARTARGHVPLVLLLTGALSASLMAADAPRATPAASARNVAPAPPAAPPVAPAKPIAPAAEATAPKPATTEENPLEVVVTQALDQVTPISFNEVPIRDAMRELGEKTGIPIEVETGTVRFLPYGSETRVTATIEGLPLRDVLTAILRQIGLTSVVEGNKVVIRPSKPLQRLARRATWKELAMLEGVRTQKWSEEFFKTLKIQFQDIPGAKLEAKRDVIRKAAEGVGAGTMAEVLDLATEPQGWTWFAEEERVVILPAARQVERQLARPISVKYQQVNLRDVLLDLARQADTSLQLDPGALMSVPAQLAERFSLTVDNATVRQALEIIAGQTGLGYLIEGDGIRVTASALQSPTTQAASAEDIALRTATTLRSNSFIGTFEIPGKDGVRYTFFLRESDLPSDVNDMRKQKLKEMGEAMRAALTPAGPPTVKSQ